jgi:hypothetical protein
MKWMTARLREPSTWAGLAGLIPSVLTLMANPTPAAIGGVVAGTAAVLMKEKGGDA